MENSQFSKKSEKGKLNFEGMRVLGGVSWGNNFWDSLHQSVLKIFRWAACFAVPPLASIGVTPNQVTVLSAILNFGLAAFCFIHGTYFWNLAGLFFLILHYYFDLVDGSLARATGKTSILGRWLDMVCDYLGSTVILASLGYGVYKNTNNNFWLVITISIMFARFAISVAHLYYGNSIYRDKDFREEFKKNTKMIFIDWLVKEFVVYESSLFFFLFTLTYSLFLAIVINQIPIFLVMIAFLYNLRWLVLFCVYALVLDNKKEKIGVLKLLKKYIDPSIFAENK